MEPVESNALSETCRNSFRYVCGTLEDIVIILRVFITKLMMTEISFHPEMTNNPRNTHREVWSMIGRRTWLQREGTVKRNF